MKKLIYASFVVLWIISACTSSKEDVQKVLAETQPTWTPTPLPSQTSTLSPSPTTTLIPLSDIDLEPILILPEDLPAGYSGAQIESLDVNYWGDAVETENSIRQGFEKDGKNAGDVTICLYNSLGDRDIDYLDVLYRFESASSNELFEVATYSQLPGVGEKAEYMDYEIKTGGIHIVGVNLVFVRCNALVYINMSEQEWIDIEEATNIDMRDTPFFDYASAYAQRLDGRLSELVCR